MNGNDKLILPPPNHSEIVTNSTVDSYLYLELYNNLSMKDDVKSLAICRLILAQDPTNEKIKELNDLLFNSISENYKQTGQLEYKKEDKMDPHMKLNKEGEYEYYSSGDESDSSTKAKKKTSTKK